MPQYDKNVPAAGRPARSSAHTHSSSGIAIPAVAQPAELQKERLPEGTAPVQKLTQRAAVPGPFRLPPLIQEANAQPSSPLQEMRPAAKIWPVAQQRAAVARHGAKSTGSVYQRVPIKKHGNNFFPVAHPVGNIVESDELTNEERRQVNTDLAANAVLLGQIRAGWRRMAPLVQALRTAGINNEREVIRGLHLYNASQDAGQALPQLLGAQSDWQNFLADNRVPMATILSLHRSFGFEYEFATWEPINQANVVSHTEVGQSASFSRLFDRPFILETDAQHELELVAPPLLAGAFDGSVNKAFMSAVHNRFIAYLANFRQTNLNTRVDRLPFDGEIGNGWHWDAAAQLIRVAAQRDKWAQKANQIGYQLNVTLKPEEIAAQVRNVGGGELASDHGRVYIRIRDRFLNHVLYTGLSVQRKRAIEPAILLLAKGIGNSIAIPTLHLVAQTREPWKRNDLHSYVKDLHGIWIKDSVPNITVAAVARDVQAMADLNALVTALRGDGDLIPRDILTNVPQYRPQGAANTLEMQQLIRTHDPNESGSSRLKLLASQEAAACLTEVSRRLQHNVGAQPNAQLAFLAEQFGTGEGVRKDTYVNVPASAQSSMHLAELRSNASTDAFLA